MLQPTVEHRMNTATARQVTAHLLACGPYFVPPLGERVDIAAYAAKIVLHAQRFEGWSGSTLVGLVAAYTDVDSARFFITNVSVLPSWSSRGIASMLLRECLTDARKSRAMEVVLEVDSRNSAAVSLYERIGFRRMGGDLPKETMTLQLLDKP